jgi:tRNA pseudouridine65 synthase
VKLDILYDDQDIAVINKPSGLLVHRSDIDKSATEFAMQTLRDQLGKQVYPAHRLDRPASGALIFALTPESARRLGEDFTSGKVLKTYLALVRGVPAAQAQIDHPLKEILDRKTDFQCRTDKPAQIALTEVKRLKTYDLPYGVDKYPTALYSLVQAHPKTGRKHQIRRHLRHIGHPIVGDITHGVGRHNRFFESEFGIRRLLLACTEISFSHPTTSELMTVKAPIASDFATLLKTLEAFSIRPRENQVSAPFNNAYI